MAVMLVPVNAQVRLDNRASQRRSRAFAASACIAAVHPALADVIAIGEENSSLGVAARMAAKRVGLKLSPDPAPERLYLLLGDQYSFIKARIPAVWLISGGKSRDPGVDVPASSRD